MPTPLHRVLVTAGANGIGRAIAQAFRAAGAAVHVCDIDAAQLQALQAESPGITTSACDMGDAPAVQRMVEAAAAALGGLDVLVNNAGIAGPTVDVERLPLADWEAVLRVNLTGTFVATQAAIPHLKRAGGGSVIVMSSVAGRFGYPDRAAYASSKWALVGFTKTLARELGPHAIRANAILPGAVDGARMQSVLAARASASGRSLAAETEDALANQSLPWFVDPQDIAALAVFLASDAARSISGQMLPIDGDSQGAA